MSAAVLQVSNLYKSFASGHGTSRTKLVLRGLSLRVASSEVVCLHGDNGAGKTTLLKIIASLIKPDSGHISLVGEVQDGSAAQRRLVGLASGDDRSFFLRLTGRQNLRFFAQLYGLSPKTAQSRIGQLAEELDLVPVLDEVVSALSSGVRARLGLARALLHEPPLLLLDEPTKSVDKPSTPAVHALIADCARSGSAVLVVTHEPSEREAIATRALRLYDGQLEEAITSARGREGSPAHER